MCLPLRSCRALLHAAAQGLILLAYLLNQGLKKRTFREEHTEEKYKHTLAERGYGPDEGVVVDARAPAGPGLGPSGNGGVGPAHGQAGIANGGVYGSSVRPVGAGVQSV